MAARRTWVVATAVLAAAIAAAGWWRQQRQDVPALPAAREVLAPVSPPTPRAEEPATPAPAIAPRAPVAPPVAAPSGMPPATLDERALVEQIEELAQAARAGDDVAACRLGTTVQRCLSMASLPLYDDPAREAAWIAKAPAEQQEMIIEAAARSRIRMEELRAQCRGITPESHQRLALETLLRPAQRGRAWAAEAFLRTPLTAADLLRDPAMARLYGEHAPVLFRSLWDAGDPRAVQLLATAAGMPRMGQAALHAVPPELRDAGLARALSAEMGQRLHGFTPRAGVNPINPPTPENVEAARRLWDERFEPSAATAAARERRARGKAAPPVDPMSPPDPCQDGGGL